MITKFKVNFADPGKNLPQPEVSKAGLAWLLGAAKKKKVGIAVSFLVILFMVMLSGGVFYVVVVYSSEKETIEKKKQELKNMEIAYNIQKTLRMERENKTRESLKTIKGLRGKKKDFITWSERLNALNRALVKNLWLSSLEIDVKEAPKAKGGKKGKQQQQEQQKEATPREYTVNIRGATYSAPKNKPLNKIADFLTRIKEEPFWGNYFVVRDWHINSRKNEDKVLNFEIIMESKAL